MLPLRLACSPLCRDVLVAELTEGEAIGLSAPFSVAVLLAHLEEDSDLEDASER
jgi:hypothetical protein